MSHILRFSHLNKVYPDGTQAVVDFDLEVQRGEFIVLIGPSGCGKTTTLRMVNRLVEPTGGTIYLEGEDYRRQNPVQLRRRLGYVIQQIGLIPHLTIGENIGFVLRLQGVAPSVRRARAEELMQLAGLDAEQYIDRYPNELSGGQQQRIGVLRALAHDPDIILMDEPFGALDPIMREQLQDELKRLQQTVHKTILFVTHDIDEALRLADRIVMMREGGIVQIDAPEEMLRHPKDAFVTQFIGPQRLLRQASEVQVCEVMTAGALVVEGSQGIAQTLEHMRHRRVNSAFIRAPEDGSFAGIVLAHEIEAALARNETQPVAQLARRRDMAVRSDAPALNAMRNLLVGRLNAVPVVDDDGRIVGVVTRGGLVGVLDSALQLLETPDDPADIGAKEA